MQEWRRSKVLELAAKGHNQIQISQSLNVHASTISRDISYLRETAKHNLKEHIENRLPYELEQCLEGITQIIQEAWTISANTQGKKEKLQSLNLAKDCYSAKIDLVTNSTILKDAVNFVQQSKEKLNNNKNQQQNNNNNKKQINKKKKESLIEQNDLEGSAEDYNPIRESNYNNIF